jgi:hypothetical protein
MGKPIQDIKDLKKQLEVYQKNEKFKVGDIVVWKNEIWKNKTVPLLNQPAIVMEVLDTPIMDCKSESGENHGSGSTYYRERMDIVLGSFCPSGDGDVLRFHHDSRRFRKI